MGFQLYYCVSCIVGAAFYWQWKHEYNRPAKNSFNIRFLCHFNVFLMLHSTDVAGQWFSPITLVSSTSKNDCHDITEILLKVALNTLTLTLTHCFVYRLKFGFVFLFHSFPCSTHRRDTILVFTVFIAIWPLSKRILKIFTSLIDL